MKRLTISLLAAITLLASACGTGNAQSLGDSQARLFDDQSSTGERRVESGLFDSIGETFEDVANRARIKTFMSGRVNDRSGTFKEGTDAHIEDSLRIVMEAEILLNWGYYSLPEDSDSVKVRDVLEMIENSGHEMLDEVFSVINYSLIDVSADEFEASYELVRLIQQGVDEHGFKVYGTEIGNSFGSSVFNMIIDPKSGDMMYFGTAYAE